MAIIDGLMKDQKYLVGVRAFTKMGDGPMSQEIRVATTREGSIISSNTPLLFVIV